MNRIRSRLAPLAALMALLLALAGCSAAPSTEEPGTASQTKYATGKYTQTEVTPAVDSGFAPAKLQMLDGVPGRGMAGKPSIPPPYKPFWTGWTKRRWKR